MIGPFELIEANEEGFQHLINQAIGIVPSQATALFKVENCISASRVLLARRHYMGELARYAEYLHSRNPDHYKRSGALLNALCTNPVISEITAEHSREDMDDPIGPLGRYTSDDLKPVKAAIDFHEEYCNQFVAFEISYRACLAYEPVTKPLPFGLIHNICHYLKNNTSLPADAYNMLFRTLMA